MAVREFAPVGEFAWRGSKKRTLGVTVWYPAQASAQEVAINSPVDAPNWQADSAAVDAPAAPNKRGYPLVVLSHGNGGAGIQLAWLGAALARRGFVAAAVNHPGNSYQDTTTLEGFALRWERARDLRVVIDGMLADKDFRALVDAKRIGAAGFSLGGFTVMELAGGRSDPAGFRRYCASHMEACTPPPGLANVMSRIEAKSSSDPEFRAALNHAGDSYLDERVRAVFAMAPAVGHSVTRQSLASIRIPVRIVVGDNDHEAAAKYDAAYYAESIQGARLDILAGGVGHYVFLDLPTAKGKSTLPEFAVDAPGVDRAALHTRVVKMAIEFFQDSLK
jgi:predicted dienelactone hydrolase